MYNLKYYSSNGKMINLSPRENIFITKTDGLTANVVSFSETQSIGQTGSTMQGQVVQPKNITIEGEIAGMARDTRQRFLDTITPLESGRLYYDDKMYLDVTPMQTPDIQRKPYNSKFQFVLRAFFPYWRNANVTMSDVVGLTPMFHFPINYGNTYFENPLLHEFGRRTDSYFTNVTNRGNVPAPFIVMFIAKTALKNPKITMVDTGEFLRIHKDMQAGERIVIDLTKQVLEVSQLLEGAETDAINYFDINSSVTMSLKAGDNLIRYDADENRGGLDVKIIHHDTWAGAFGNDRTI